MVVEISDKVILDFDPIISFGLYCKASARCSTLTDDKAHRSDTRPDSSLGIPGRPCINRSWSHARNKNDSTSSISRVPRSSERGNETG